MPPFIQRLLGLPSWRAFDVDDEGRVLAGSDQSGSVQLVEIAPDGTTGTPLTALPGTVSGRYLPGERTVVIEHDTDGDERAQLSLLRLDRTRTEPATWNDLTPVVRDPRHVHRLLDVAAGRIVYTTNRRNGVDFDVLIRSTVTGEEQVVFNGGGMVLSVAVADDTRYVALTVPGVPPMSEQLLVVDTMPTTSVDVTALTAADNHATHTQISWLPENSGLIVTTNHDRDLTGVARIDTRDGTLHWLVRSEEHDLTGWPSPNGRKLLVQANEDGTTRFTLHYARTGNQQSRVDLPGEGWCSRPSPTPVWSPNSRYVAFTHTSPTAPSDVVLLDTETTRTTTLTDSPAQLQGERLVTPTTHRVPAADGAQIPCFVYRPSNPPAELAGSAVLVLHGGPESQSVRAFSPVVQGLVAQGHTVLVPNVRGSTGYGKEWYSADDVRRRLDAVADLAALHDWLPSLDLDPARAALWGGSYGGYLVLAGLAFQPQRWAAGVDIVGISSLTTFLENTAPYRRAHREREYGSLTHDADFLHEASPLTKVDAISAPLFVIHGANDPRVPLSEAEQLAAAVRANDVECELVVYEDEGHGLAQRANRLDAYPRAITFLARHLSR